MAKELTKNGLQIGINVYSNSLTVKEMGQTIKTYPVATGAKATPTPVGEYRIIQKAQWGGPFGTRWMQLDVPWGTYGIHGTNRPGSIGKAVSHGCIRMQNRDVEELYERVAIGTQVVITGPVPKVAVAQGSTGNLVQLIQGCLEEQGFYTGCKDGIFGPKTEEAVILFQTAMGLIVTGVITPEQLTTLGVKI